MTVGSVSQVVSTILIRGNTNLESIGSEGIENTREGLVGHKQVAHVNSVTILDTHNGDIGEVEHEVTISDFSAVEEGLQLINLRSSTVLQNLSDIDVDVVNQFSAVTSILGKGVRDLLIEFPEVSISMDDSRTGQSTDSQVREFVSEPSRESTRVRTTNSNPRHISSHTENVVVLNELNEPRQIVQSLLGSQVL